MTKEISKRLYQDIREAASGFDLTVRSYSGRNMNGEYCLGVSGELKDIVSFALNLGVRLKGDTLEECGKMFAKMRMDDMGRDDTIAYFPGYMSQDLRDRMEMDEKYGMSM